MAPMAELLFALAVIFLLLGLHPYITYPLSLMLIRRSRPQRPEPGWRRPTLAICMSAYNEEAMIVAKVEGLLAAAQVYGPAKIHLYIDGSTDRTVELVEPYRDRVNIAVSNERRGKTFGLKDVVSASESELLAFTDANVVMPADSILSLVEAMQSPDVCGASARLVYSNPQETGMSASGAVYWNIEEAIKSLESETVGMIGVDGALFVIERSAYSPPPDELIDDLYVSMCAVLTGKRVVSAQGVVVEERSAANWREEFNRKIRISCQGINIHRALWPRLVKAPPRIFYCYMSHRFLRWMSPFTLLVSGLCLLTSLWLTFGVVIPVGVAILAGLLLLGALLNAPGFRMVVAALTAMAGVAEGVIEAVLTRQMYTTWTPASTVRN
jgi:cellulose synthase/poly-beta-1,6-N-acetylglucosamine synthase-like glycosyltransferase